MKTQFYIYISVVCLFLSFSEIDALSAPQKYGIYMNYAEGYTTYHAGELCSNMIKVFNNTDKNRTFSLRTVGHPDWRSLGKPNRVFQIPPRDSIFIPIRLLPSKEVNGGNLIRFKSSLYNEGVMITTAEWIIETETIHDLDAQVLKKETYFLHDSDSTFVMLKFENHGNVDEQIELNYHCSRSLEVYNVNKKLISLPRGADTTIRVDVKIVQDVTMNAAEIFRKPKRSFDKYSLKIKAIAVGASMQTWQRSATFIKVRDSYNVNEMKWDNLPMTLDFQMYDMLSENPYASIGLYGVKRIDDERYATYNFQFLGAAGANTSLTSNYQNVAYYTPTLKVAVGDVSTNSRSALVMRGKGAVVSKILNTQHTVSGLYTRSNDFFSSDAVQNMSLGYGYKTKDEKMKSDIYIQNKNIPLNNSNKSIVGLQVSRAILENQNLSIQTDFSNAIYDLSSGNQKLNGYRFHGVYSGRFFTYLNTGLNYQLSSKDFASFGGGQNFKAYANYWLKNDRMLIGYYSNRKYSPNLWSNGILISSGLRSEQEEAKLSYRFRVKKQSFSLYGQYNENIVRGYDLNKIGVGIEYMNSFSLYSRFNTSFSMWQNDFSENTEGTYNTMMLKLTYRQRNLRMSANYYYGARYMSEHLFYSETHEMPRSYYLSSNYEFWPGKDKSVLVNISSTLNYRSATDRFQLSFRPNFDYYISHSFKLKGYMSVLAFDQGDRYYNYNDSEILSPGFTQANFEMGIGFTKDFGIPISRKKNYDVKFVVFRDDDGNGRREGNELVIKNMLIIASKIEETNSLDFDSYTEPLEIMTNENGEAAFLNLPQGSYRIETYPLDKVESWFSNRNFSITVVEDRTILLAQAKGGRIYGNIYLKTANYSRFEKGVNLDNIKVTATDSTGMVYNCLTDNDGAYILNAPMGRYSLSVNAELFAGSFDLVENNIKVELNQMYSSVETNFFVKEKKRKIEIKTFGEKATDSNETENANLDSTEIVTDGLNDTITDSSEMVNDVLEDTTDSTKMVTDESNDTITDLPEIETIDPNDRASDSTIRVNLNNYAKFKDSTERVNNGGVKANTTTGQVSAEKGVWDIDFTELDKEKAAFQAADSLEQEKILRQR